jgi:hypothetical protein
MPGKKDYILAEVGGIRVHEHKWLLLHNVKELYFHCKSSHLLVRAGFSKFVLLHPRNCIMSDASSIHCLYICMCLCVCVWTCTIHRNVKLMIEACKISGLTRSIEHHLSVCQHCLSNMICSPPWTDCFFFHDLSECPGSGVTVCLCVWGGGGGLFQPVSLLQ